MSPAEKEAITAFRNDVVEPSMTKLVIIDFWAEWCGPCKALTPLLEKVAAAYADKGVVLAKIDTDKNQFIASQFQIKSIPTVYAMFQGQLVADLTPARTESALKTLLDGLLRQLPIQAEAVDEAADLEPLIAMGESVLADGDAVRALSIFDQLVEMAPEHPAVLSGRIRALVAAGLHDEAQAALDALPADIKDVGIDRARALGRAGPGQSRRPQRPLSARQCADGGRRPRQRGGQFPPHRRRRPRLERGRRAHPAAQAVRGRGADGPLGLDAAPAPVRGAVRMRMSIFPLTGALLFPGMHLPLHVFEPRYRALVGDAMARDRRIGMIQPNQQGDHGDDERPPLYDVGCVGRIADVEALDDGRYNLVLEGVSLFRIVRELDVPTAFRQVEAELIVAPDRDELSLGRRSSLEIESRRFAETAGYSVDWDAVARLDDENLVNGIAQIAPFDAAAKQALLEAETLEQRAELIIQLMEFFGRHGGEDRVTLQ